MASFFDCVVVGAGIEGSCTALQLARAGKRTLLIDQFEQGHTRGSSHGGSRIIRYAYREAHYARLMPHAYKAWNAIEQETGEQIIVTTGLVNVSTIPPHNRIDQLTSTMASLSLPHEVVDGAVINSRWPSLSYPDHAKALFDPTAGVVKADVALKAVQDLFIRLGGEAKWGMAVKKVIPGDTVTLKTENGDFTAASVVLCPGPWAGPLLALLDLALPLQAQVTDVFYWPEKQQGSYSAPDHPTLIDLDTYDEHIFTCPALEFPGMAKVCGRIGPIGKLTVDPDAFPFDVDKIAEELIGQYIQEHIPALDCKSCKRLTCFYTKTPDFDFILDKHPSNKNIIIGVGFSGTGFKLAPVVGQILTSLVLDQTPPYDITAFRIDRFL